MSTVPTGENPDVPGWRIGMPTRCGKCLSPRLAYHADESATCLVCGAVTLANRGSPFLAGAGSPATSAPRPAEAPQAPVPSPAASWSDVWWGTGLPPLPSYQRVRTWDDRITWATVGAIVLSLLLVFGGVPLLLSFSPNPIVHMSDYYITLDSQCNVMQHVTLSNEGGRAGMVTLAFYVDGSPYTNWSALLEPRTVNPEVFETHVASCTTQRYAIGLSSVVPS